jgi:hypothetical protein
MRLLSSSALLPLLCLAGAALGVGCEEALPPGTTIAEKAPALQGREAVVTFVRPVSPCDTGEYAVVVDDHGRFVGNVAAGTRVSYATEPGRHVFYAWSNVELVVLSNPNFSAVAAVRADVRPGEPNYILMDSAKPCQGRLSLEIASVRAMRDPAAGLAEVTGLLERTTPVNSDVVAGQAALDSRRARVHFYMELGKMTLRRRDLAREEARRAAAFAKGDSTEGGLGLDE